MKFINSARSLCIGFLFCFNKSFTKATAEAQKAVDFYLLFFFFRSFFMYAFFLLCCFVSYLFSLEICTVRSVVYDSSTIEQINSSYYGLLKQFSFFALNKCFRLIDKRKCLPFLLPVCPLHLFIGNLIRLMLSEWKTKS